MVDYFGVAYLKVPRIILDQIVSSNPLVRRQGLLHLVLFISCSYSEKTVKFGGRILNCSVGDYVGTHGDLGKKLGIDVTKVGRMLRHMEEIGLICMTRIPGGCKIHLYGYAAFTAAQEVVSAKAAGKEPENLGDELEKAKEEFGGRRMDYDDLDN